MLSKSQIKYIRSLKQQKYRKENNVFTAEGDKIAREYLKSDVPVLYILGLETWVRENEELVSGNPEASVHIISEMELQSLSSLQSPNQVLLVVERPKPNEKPPVKGWSLGLDGIQDPGNMGTLIRIADWFGIPHIICSPDCVDVYNPKVVQAAMGGHLRVSFFEADLVSHVSSLEIPVLAASLAGENLQEFTPFEQALLLIGNESKGLNPKLSDKATHKIRIPGRGKAESLNAAVAAGILCSQLLPR